MGQERLSYREVVFDFRDGDIRDGDESAFFELGFVDVYGLLITSIMFSQNP